MARSVMLWRNQTLHAVSPNASAATRKHLYVGRAPRRAGPRALARGLHRPTCCGVSLCMKVRGPGLRGLGPGRLHPALDEAAGHRRARRGPGPPPPPSRWRWPINAGRPCGPLANPQVASSAPIRRQVRHESRGAAWPRGAGRARASDLRRPRRLAAARRHGRRLAPARGQPSRWRVCH